MNALRACLARLVDAHVALAERITPDMFAWTWGGVAVGALAGSILAPDPATGLALAFVGIGGAAMSWANATGRIHR